MKTGKQATGRIGVAGALAAAGAMTAGAGGQPVATPTVDAAWLHKEMQWRLVDDFIEDAQTLRPPGDEFEFDQADVFFEENATDGDLGIHFEVDGEAWDRVWIFDAEGRRFVDLRARGAAAENGIAGVFSESAEPDFDEVPRDEFLSWFPAGEYLFIGWTIEGDVMVSNGTLTHDMPVQPQAVFPVEGQEVDASQPLVIRWNAVADPAPPESVITGYQVIVTREEENLPERVFLLELDAGHTSATVSPEFLTPDTEYKYEVIARETSGNQTITEIGFSTAEASPAAEARRAKKRGR